MKRFIDIGANLTDSMYNGIYHGSKKHEPDLINVLNRAWDAGLEKILITGGNLSESQKAYELSLTNEKLFSTVGCHPTRCQEFEENPDDYLSNLEALITRDKRKIVAIGECGLDYDRLEFCPKDIQKKYFDVQLKLSEKLKKPLFLHCRNAAADFIEIVSKYQNLTGVVHSFDGSVDDMKTFVDMGFYIGINGCSLKTEENLNTMKEIPSNRLLLETDCPWCEVRPTHAGFKYIKTHFPSVKKEKWKAENLVKSRNEPCNIQQIYEIISQVRDDDTEELSERIFNNTMELFFKDN